MADKSPNFWTRTVDGANNPIRDPKRAFRFLLNVVATGDQWIVKKVGKPTLSINAAEHAYINHTFYYPGRVTWEEVSFTLIDPVTPNASANMAAIITAAGYHPPVNADDTTTMSKGKAIKSLGDIIIRQIDSNGDDVEKWSLKNAWLSKVAFSELSYEEDGLSEIECTVRYDWAELNVGSFKANISTDPEMNGKGKFFSLGS